MVLNKVKEIIAKQISVEESIITEKTTFSDVNADSLDVVEVILALEQEFEIEIPDEEVDNLNTVKDLSDFIKTATKA